MSNVSLLAVYEEMLKEAGAQEKVASETPEPNVENQGLTEDDVLSKYAEAAELELQNRHGQDYTAEDVADLASRMIAYDQQLLKQAEEAEVEEAMQKVAEAHELGTIIADAFLARIAQAQE